MKTEINQEERWQKLLLEHKTTDLTIKSFCELNDVRIHQFTYWRDKIERGIVRKKKKKASFIRITPVSKEPTTYDELSLIINGIKINVPINFNHVHLTKLIKAVQAID